MESEIVGLFFMCEAFKIDQILLFTMKQLCEEKLLCTRNWMHIVHNNKKFVRTLLDCTMSVESY